MAQAGFRLHPGAAGDITEIWQYIAADNPEAARRLREHILQTFRQLVEHPHIGRRRADLTSRSLRFQWVRD